MHIRHLVITDNFAGVERYVATTAAELGRRGHIVDVIGGNQAAMRAAIGEASRRAPGASIGDTPGGSIDSTPRAAVTEGAITMTPASKLGAAIRAVVARPRPDLVHAHMTNADIAAIVTRPLVRRPVVSTLHFAQRRGHSPLTRSLYSSIPRLVTRQLAISQAVANAAESPAIVVYEGIPGPTIEPVPGARRQIVLAVQRLEPEKDTSTIVRAFAASRLADIGWTLELAGHGAQADDLMSLAVQLGVADAVRPLGHVDDVPALLRTASIFIASTPNEGFGLSVVEAMAHGLPAVAADGGAHRETIGTATPETLFAPGDSAAAGAILRRLGDDPALRADLGARARARYEAEFTIEAHVDRLEAIYNQVVTRAPR